MRDPTRLRDDAEAASDTRALLDRAQGTRRLPPAIRARSAARLDRALVLPAAAGVLFWLKGVALATGLVVVTVVAPRVLTTLRPNATATTVKMTPREMTPRRSPIPPPEPITTPTPSASGSAAPAEPVRRAAPQTDPLTREAAMLEQARAALDHDPRGALTLLDAHRREFPAGTLAMERELVAVDALSRLGRSADARSRGEALLRAAPDSIYATRVRTMLAALPSP
jgi:hypothetical protein